MQMLRDCGVLVFFLMLVGVKLLRLKHLDWCWTKWSRGSRHRSLLCSPFWSIAQVSVPWLGLLTAAAVCAEIPNLHLTTSKHAAKSWFHFDLFLIASGGEKEAAVKKALGTLFIFRSLSLLLLIWKFSKSFLPKTSGIEGNNHLWFYTVCSLVSH